MRNEEPPQDRLYVEGHELFSLRSGPPIRDKDGNLIRCPRRFPLMGRKVRCNLVVGHPGPCR